MLNYDYPLFRPPAEANNIIIQITHGCSHNSCSFCSMYKSKGYKIREIKDIFKYIDKLSSYYHDTIKVFLADGNPFGVDTDKLIEILKYLKKSFPKLRRVSIYATAQNTQTNRWFRLVFTTVIWYYYKLIPLIFIHLSLHPRLYLLQ